MDKFEAFLQWLYDMRNDNPEVFDIEQDSTDIFYE